jgi:two-component system, cell cycle response regulator
VKNETLKLLLVENDLTYAELISNLLSDEQKANFNIQQIENLEAALEILSQDSFDAILLSLYEAENTGKFRVNSLDILKQQAPQLAIVVLTLTENLDQALQMLQHGAQDCLTKSELRGKTLIRTIKYAISRQRQRFNSHQQALMKRMVDQIRDSVDLESILQTTATEIRQFLRSDQVLVYRCESPQLAETTVIAQSVNAQFDQLVIKQFMDAVNLSSLHSTFSQSTFIQAVEDTYAQSTPALQVVAPQYIRSYLILPIWLEESGDDTEVDLTLGVRENQATNQQNPELWGMLIAYNIRGTRRWQDWEISFLQCLTTQVTVAIRQSQLCCRLQTANQKLQKLAILDGLTGIANRRYFDLVLDKEWQRLAREQQPLSLILCDIDYFKAYNDTYGHQQGDRCLKQVAQVLQQSTKRPADLVARYGGEEFALILPHTDAPGALFLAHRIVRQLTQKALPHCQSQVSNVVTLSIGIATKIPHSKQASSTIIETADNLLYKAKKAGRNQLALDNWLTSQDEGKVPHNAYNGSQK